ncbi:MAG: (2Fe-2S)-binding protein [Actinobacteria bacterium HGW-Actinobacteria-7]|nr:MAG: (2Fe-2S)-binding protein [Actinobacteria bacterium HGW-Actinobacteria-7]
MGDFIQVAVEAEFMDGTMRQVDVDGHELLVARADGEFFIADNRCPHLGGRLSKGELDGTVVTCHLHHSMFDLRDGRVVRWTDWTGPVLTVAELARHPRPLRTYQVRVEDGFVFVGPEQLPVAEAELPY